MARRRSGFSRSRSSSRSSRNTRTAQAPPRQNTNTKPQAKSGGMFSGLMGTMFTGMAFGAGSEVAHTVVGSMMGKGQNQEQAPQQAEQNNQQHQQNSCSNENNRFVECLKLNSNSISDCQIYLDLLKQCERQ